MSASFFYLKLLCVSARSFKSAICPCSLLSLCLFVVMLGFNPWVIGS